VNAGYVLITDGAEFTGSTTFMPREFSQGCMQFDGDLVDTADDGRSVYVHGKVMGYGWAGRTEIYDGQGSTSPASACLYDPAATQVQYGWVAVCVNRNNLPDRCTEQRFERPGNSLPPVSVDDILP